MADINKDTKETVGTKPVAVNAPKTGDILVKVKDGYSIEDSGNPYGAGTVVWLNKDAVDYHLSIGSVEKL